MEYEILNADGTVGNVIVADEAFVEEHFPGRWRPAGMFTESIESNPIAERIARIKTEARERLVATEWRLERARERHALDLPGESLAEVWALRESIRRASSRAEKEVAALEDVEKILDYEWDVTDADTVSVRLLSKFKFLSRFSGEERARLLAAANAEPALNAYLLMLQTAESVNLDDPATGAGLAMLEQSGLLSSGRAAEILA